MVNLSAITAVSTLLLGLTLAGPVPNQSGHSLRKREVFYDDSCDRDGPNGKPMKEKVEQAFADAATMARWTQDTRIKDQVGFYDSPAYKHYFGDDSKYPDIVKRAIQFFVNNNNPANQVDGYRINVKCGSDQEKECTSRSLAVTTILPGQPDMTLCDLFFKLDTAQTKNDLSSMTYDADGWCKGGQKFPYFEVAATTILHEMTHLDMFGVTVQLPEIGKDPNKSHGTVDIESDGEPKDTNKYKNLAPWAAARKLVILWADYDKDKENYVPLGEPIQNAEGFAAAITEFYFSQKCKFDYILPESGFK